MGLPICFDVNVVWNKDTSFKCLRYQYLILLKMFCFWHYIRTTWQDENLFFNIQVSRTVSDPDVRLKVILGKILLIWKMWCFNYLAKWCFRSNNILSVPNYQHHIFVQNFLWNFEVEFYSLFQLFSRLICHYVIPNVSWLKKTTKDLFEYFENNLGVYFIG